MARKLLLCVLLISLITPHQFKTVSKEDGAKAADDDHEKFGIMDELNHHKCPNRASCGDNQRAYCIRRKGHDGEPVYKEHCFDNEHKHVTINNKEYAVHHTCPPYPEMQGPNNLGGGRKKDCGPDSLKSSCTTSAGCPGLLNECCSDGCAYHCKELEWFMKSTKTTE